MTYHTGDLRTRPTDRTRQSSKEVETPVKETTYSRSRARARGRRHGPNTYEATCGKVVGGRPQGTKEESPVDSGRYDCPGPSKDECGHTFVPGRRDRTAEGSVDSTREIPPGTVLHSWLPLSRNRRAHRSRSHPVLPREPLRHPCVIRNRLWDKRHEGRVG